MGATSDESLSCSIILMFSNVALRTGKAVLVSLKLRFKRCYERSVYHMLLVRDNSRDTWLAHPVLGQPR